MVVECVEGSGIVSRVGRRAGEGVVHGYGCRVGLFVCGYCWGCLGRSWCRMGSVLVGG